MSKSTRTTACLRCESLEARDVPAAFTPTPAAAVIPPTTSALHYHAVSAPSDPSQSTADDSTVSLSAAAAYNPSKDPRILKRGDR